MFIVLSSFIHLFILLYLFLFRKLIPLEDLTAENVLYWRCLCEYLKSKGEEGEDVLEQVLPEPAIYADYLLRYIAFKNKSLITKLECFFLN